MLKFLCSSGFQLIPCGNHCFSGISCLFFSPVVIRTYHELENLTNDLRLSKISLCHTWLRFSYPAIISDLKSMHYECIIYLVLFHIIFALHYNCEMYIFAAFCPVSKTECWYFYPISLSGLSKLIAIFWWALLQCTNCPKSDDDIATPLLISLA